MRRRAVSRATASAVLASILFGCGISVPSAGDPSTAPTATTAATATTMPDPTAATTPTPVPDDTPGVEGGVFRTVHVMADGSGPLPIVLTDLTRLVSGIVALPQGEPPFDERVSNPDGQPSVLRYQWTGGACDLLASITFERTDAGFRLVNVTKTTGGICIAIGIFRSIDIHLVEPVNSDSVTVGGR